jgi:hypothetical protein
MNILEAKHRWKSAAPTRPRTSSRGKTRPAAPTRWGGQKARTLQRQVHRDGWCRRKSFRRTPAHPIQAGGIPCRALTQSGHARDELTRPWQTTETQNRDLEGKGAQRARRQEDAASGREARHGCYSRDEPLFKGRLPCSRLEMSREVSPDAHSGYPSYDTGPVPQVIQLARWSSIAKKANRRTRSVLPLAVVRPLIFAATSGPTSGMGAQAHMSCTWRVGFYVRRRRTDA